MTKTLVVLDTCMVRAVVHNDNDALVQLANFKALKDKARFCIADVALAEATLALLEDRLPWEDWSARIHLIDEILDGDFPILPGHRELAEMAKLSTLPSVAELGGSRYWRAAWKLLSTATKPEDLKTGMLFTDDQTKKKYFIDATLERARTVLGEARDRWAKYFEKIKPLLNGQKSSEAKIVAIMQENFAADSGFVPDAATRLDAQIRSLARFLYLTFPTNGGHAPRKRQ